MTHNYPGLGSASDCLKQIFSQLEPLPCHQQGISALGPQTLFRGETRGAIGKFTAYDSSIKMSNFLQIPVALLALLYFLKQGRNKEITVY